MDYFPKLRTSRKKPQRVPDGNYAASRADNFGGIFGSILTGRDDGLADEGSYFVASNPAPGTGLNTIAAPTTFVDTAPFILIKNESKPSELERIYLKYLKLTCAAAGTGGASVRYAVKTDDANDDRYTSGGSKSNNGTLNLVNVNQDDSTPPAATVYAGALVASAASDAARLITSGILRVVIPVAGDTYFFNFGGPSGEIGALAPAGSAIANLTIPAPPVVIGPQQWAAFHLWLPSQSAASAWEFELAYTKR